MCLKFLEIALDNETLITFAFVPSLKFKVHYFKAKESPHGIDSLKIVAIFLPFVLY